MVRLCMRVNPSQLLTLGETSRGLCYMSLLKNKVCQLTLYDERPPSDNKRQLKTVFKARPCFVTAFCRRENVHVLTKKKIKRLRKKDRIRKETPLAELKHK